MSSSFKLVVDLSHECVFLAFSPGRHLRHSAAPHHLDNHRVVLLQDTIQVSS